MNDLKLLTALEQKLNLHGRPELVTFDTNMGTVYLSDYSKVYGINSNDLIINNYVICF